MPAGPETPVLSLIGGLLVLIRHQSSRFLPRPAETRPASAGRESPQIVHATLQADSASLMFIQSYRPPTRSTAAAPPSRTETPASCTCGSDPERLHCKNRICRNGRPRSMIDLKATGPPSTSICPGTILFQSPGSCPSHGSAVPPGCEPFEGRGRIPARGCVRADSRGGRRRLHPPVGCARRLSELRQSTVDPGWPARAGRRSRRTPAITIPVCWRRLFPGPAGPDRSCSSCPAIPRPLGHARSRCTRGKPFNPFPPHFVRGPAPQPFDQSPRAPSTLSTRSGFPTTQHNTTRR